jgi:hypothetical protein
MRINTLSLLLGLPLVAYGYTDPGTGIFLYQAIIATVVGAGWTARRFLSRLIGKIQNQPTIAQD